MATTIAAEERYDIVVVGARCAGSALAIQLAEAGMSVVVVDSAPLGSGQPASTHLIQPPGMDQLDLLGLGDDVRELSPALHRVRMFFDDTSTQLSYGSGRAAHCLRRAVLDSRLQQRAQAAGATLRDRTRVLDIVRDEAGRVAGVDVRSEQSGLMRLMAPLVVGADGRHSTVAKLVGAKEYFGYDAPRACYWAYWRRSSRCDPHLVYNCFNRYSARIVFPTDGDMLLIATAPPLDHSQAWRDDRSAAYRADVHSYEPIAALLDDADPISDIRGVVHNRYFFRQSAGPGWALIGDAGHHKDFVVGLGITDALRDARSLAAAIAIGHPGAIEHYWRHRDVERIEMFHWARNVGAADRVNALERLVGHRADRDPDLPARLGAVIDGQLSPFKLIPPSRALPWTIAELSRGKGGALKELVRTGLHALRARGHLWRLRRRQHRRSDPGRVDHARRPAERGVPS